MHFEFYAESKDENHKKGSNVVQSIHMENVDQMEKLPTQIMEELLETFSIPGSKQVLLYTHIRLAHLFPKYAARLQCVQARLQAISILGKQPEYCSLLFISFSSKSDSELLISYRKEIHLFKSSLMMVAL